MDFKEKLKARAEKEGISLTPKQLGQFELFYKMLIETNKSMNLTAITDEDDGSRFSGNPTENCLSGN